jgi:hypothetical protein
VTWYALAFWTVFALLDVRAYNLALGGLKVKAINAGFGESYRISIRMNSMFYDLPGSGIFAYFRFAR